jgi:thiamine biosynthesis protein ThiS
MNVIINGERREIPDGMTVQKLIHYLELKEERIAVERNREILRRAEWDETLIQEGDTLEIVHFVGGGTGAHL